MFDISSEQRYDLHGNLQTSDGFCMDDDRLLIEKPPVRADLCAEREVFWDLVLDVIQLGLQLCEEVCVFQGVGAELIGGDVQCEGDGLTVVAEGFAVVGEYFSGD